MEGVNHIHSNGYAHLDLKHDNVLLNDNLEVKICDFGHALTPSEYINIYRGTEQYNPKEVKF